MLADLVGAEAADQRQPARLVLRVEHVDQREQRLGREARPDLGADRILDAAQIFDMRVIELARAVARPQEMARGRIPIARRGIDARESLLVAEHQRLVARIEARGAKLRRVVRREPDGAHEAQRLGDMLGDLLVAVPGGAVLDEAEIPPMHMLEIGVAALREGTQQIERRGRLAIGHQHALRVGNARGLGELDAVDDVAAIARQLLAVLRLGRRRAGLGELAGDAAELHHRRAAGIGQHHRHLQEHAEEVADGVWRDARRSSRRNRRPAAERLRPRPRGRASPSARAPRPRTPAAGRSQAASRPAPSAARIGIDRDLLDRLRAPAVWAPTRRH